MGLSGPASAATVLYQNDNANVKISGGEVTALNNCITDAQDGVIQTQIVTCGLVAGPVLNPTLLSLGGVSVWVITATPPLTVLYHGDRVSVSVSGGRANAIIACLADAQDGVIQTQMVNCRQAASIGNLISLANVRVRVDQP